MNMQRAYLLQASSLGVSNKSPADSRKDCTTVLPFFAAEPGLESLERVANGTVGIHVM